MRALSLLNLKNRITTSAICVLTLVSSLVAPPVSHADSGFSATAGRPFAANGVWNSPIASNPSVDSKSTAMTSELSGGTNQQNAALYEFAIPIYNATSSTPKVTVTCTENWGTCPVAGQIRIPSNARPHSGSDGAMVVIDWTTNTSYEFWQARKINSTTWQTSWGGKATDVINGTGIDAPSSTASNMSRLGGVIREREIAAGVIPHALSFSTGLSCPNIYRYPATKTDGMSTSAGCLPQGARVQLDPSINIDALPGITPGEKAVARALQVYGAYNVDRDGSRLGLSFELPASATASNPISTVYKNAGLQWDYFQMSHIPWNKLRVLASWDGAGTGDTTAPSAPSAVATTSVTSSSVALKWNPSTDNAGVTGYNIWRGDASYANWVQVGQVSGTTTVFTDSTVRSRTGYTYAVRGVDAAGNISASSNVISVTTP